MTRSFDRLRRVGDEPDPRFTLANERTFLAWIRTSLALVAAGIGLEAFASGVIPSVPRQVLATCLVLMGASTSGTAYRRWLRTEQAMRTGEPLPLPLLAPVLAYAIAVVAVAVLVLVLWTD